MGWWRLCAALADGPPVVCAVGLGPSSAVWCAGLDFTRDTRTAVLCGPGQLRSCHELVGGALVATVVFDPAFRDGPHLGVRAAHDPAGALGSWTDSAAAAICVPDGTRHLDLVSALTALKGCLPNHGPIVVGLGLHRRMSPVELSHLDGFDLVQHDPDDVVPTAVVDGIPGSVSRVVAEAPYAVAVGVVELHQYAGVSGGHKAVAVGCGGRETISALHHRARVVSPGVEIGRISGNPFRQAVDALGEAAGCRLALVYVPAADCWLFGNPQRVLEVAMERMQPWTSVDTLAPGAVLEVDPAKAASFYQASRAASYLALSPSPPLQPGATLIIRAHCTEGLGSELGFRRALESVSPPWGSLLTGAVPTGAGAQRAVILAMVAQRFKIRVEGCENPAALEAVGIDATQNISEPPATWLRVPCPFQRLPQYANPQSTVSS